MFYTGEFAATFLVLGVLLPIISEFAATCAEFRERYWLL